jgi:hydrogenase maturation protease
MSLPEDCSSATLVLGLGNPLRQDDGLGITAVQLLAERDLPPGVRVEEAGTPGWGLPSWLEGWSRVFLVDAARMGCSPGTWRRFGTEEVRLIGYQGMFSLHEPGLANGLALAQALDVLPEEMTFYCIEPENTGEGEELSPSVRRTLPDLVETIYKELWKRQE